MGTGHWAENTSHSIFRTRFSGVNVAKLGTSLMLRSILQYRLEGLLVPLGSGERLEGSLQERTDKQPTWVWSLHTPPALGRGRPCGHNADSFLSVRSWRWRHLEQMSKRTVISSLPCLLGHSKARRSCINSWKWSRSWGKYTRFKMEQHRHPSGGRGDAELCKSRSEIDKNQHFRLPNKNFVSWGKHVRSWESSQSPAPRARERGVPDSLVSPRSNPF